MKNNLLFFTLLFFSLITMSGCSTVEEKPALDILQIEKQAEIAYHKKKWKVAEKKYGVLIAEVPGEARYWFRLGNIFVHTNRPEKAIQAYQEAVVRKPAYVKAWQNLGIVSLKKTAHLYIEMLQYIPAETEEFYKAKKTADVLLRLIKKNLEKRTTATTGSQQQ